MFEFSLENEFDFASDDYSKLYGVSAASVFQHPVWLDALYRRLAPALGAEPLVVTARCSRDRRLTMVLPMVRLRRRGLRIVEFADLGVSDYAAPVCAPEDWEAVLRAPRAAETVGARMRPFDILRIKRIRDGAQPLERLIVGGRSARMAVSAHATALFSPFEAWRAAKIAGAYGKELARNRRYMERLGEFRFERIDKPASIETLLRQLQAYRGQRYPDDLLGRQAYFDFYKSVALAGAPLGFARAYRMSLDGVTLGGSLGLSAGGRFVGLILAYDRATYRSRSLGALTIEGVARACIADGLTMLDLSVGDEGYKTLFSAEPTALSMVTASGTLQGALADRLKARIARPASRRRNPRRAETPRPPSDKAEPEPRARSAKVDPALRSERPQASESKAHLGG